MSVLVYVETTNGKVAKNGFEAVFYGKKVADKFGGDVVAVTSGSADDSALAELGNYGASKVLVNKGLNDADDSQTAKLVQAAADKTGANIIVFSHDLIGKAVAPRVSAALKAGLVSGAIDAPSDENGFTCKVNVFSGKAFGFVNVKTATRIISLLPNSFKPESGGSPAAVEAFDCDCGAARVSVVETKTQDGEIPLPEAELVVSAGRGLKGPENWGMIEDLAKELGAATACSRPVADIGWRPHHEHVGQTGVAIRPNLYIAVGISGAIQHLAGVNGSKVIVVINTDAEAPFFKAADYGVVGDAFEVVPKLVEAVKKFKASNN
ncbi:MAG: electron transfer flavoprotein subunit alpha/FixB family protein [Crocinitomicaceae bacterium]|nr:electron transfer flavoprotein subunit alpha/FixB family protein [Crocinitomicaceae bacterium]